MRFFGSIEKTYKDDKGFLIVCGHASTEALDSQGEIVKAGAMAGALEEYMKVGNIREMHQPSAVGKALLAQQDEKGTYIEVKVVDPVASMKCEEGVYTGFSIGGKATGRDPMAKNTITGLRLTEISLVDRPANPEATFTLFKLDDELEAETEEIQTEKADDLQADDLQKGMCHVARLAYLLKEIGYLVNDQADESKREGDLSKVPAFLQAWLTQGAEILKTMTAEETAELVAAAGQNLVPDTLADQVVEEFQEGDAATQNALQMADTAADVEKAGAKFSTSTKQALIAIKGIVAHLQDQLSQLGFEADLADLSAATADVVANPNTDVQPEGDNVVPGKADTETDLQKADLEKTELVTKISDLEDQLAKAAATTDTLTKRVAELEAMPAPSKVKVLSLEKAQDVTPPNPKQEKAQELLKSTDPLDVIKGIHAQGPKRGF